MNRQQVKLDDEHIVLRNPDFIPEGEEYLWPAKGGVFHDFIPEGQTCQTMGTPVVDDKTSRSRSRKAKD